MNTITSKKVNRIVNIFATNFMINSIGSTIISNTYVLFMSTTKGFTERQISLIFGILPLISVFTFFVWGNIIDKYKKLLFISKFVNVVNIISLLSLILINDFKVFFIVNFLRNILMQPSGVVNDEYILNLSNKYNIRFGKIRVFATVGYGIAGVLCTIALKFFSPSSTMMMAIIFVILNLIGLFFLPEITEPKKFREKEDNIVSSIFNIIKIKDFRTFILTHGILTATITSATGYSIPLILIKLGAPNFYIGMLPILMIVFEILLLPFIERFKFYKDINKVLKIATILLIFRWIIIGMSKSYLVIVFITLIHGLINAILLPIPNKIVWDYVPKEKHSTAIIICNLCGFTIFPSIINIVTGYMSDYFGIGVYGFTYTLLTFISLIILTKYKFTENEAKQCEI